jgi:hypothetical protein
MEKQVINHNFEQYGVISCNVKWYDSYHRPFSREFSTLDSARNFYRSLCSADASPMFARLLCKTVTGPIVLGEYRPS